MLTTRVWPVNGWFNHKHPDYPKQNTEVYTWGGQLVATLQSTYNTLITFNAIQQSLVTPNEAREAEGLKPS